MTENMGRLRSYSDMEKMVAKVLKNERVAHDIYRMRLEAPHIAKKSVPGQFVHVKCDGPGGPLLRRPLSIHRASGRTIELLYEVLGKGTDILSKKRAGDALDMIGPLGTGFSRMDKGCSEVILAAGGIGVAPLLALAEKMAGDGKARACVIIGAKTKEHILCEKDFRKLGLKVHIATDDGSKGKKGFVTAILKEMLSARIGKGCPGVYACGPMPMLKAVAAITAQSGASCQVSLEERMACGVGVCLGCPVETKAGYRMVCKDGPVFGAKDILWDHDE